MKIKECNNCGGKNIGVRTDKRGVGEYYCKDCDKGLGKASSADLVNMLDDLIEDNKPQRVEPKKAPCKFCTEDYFYRMGRLGTVYLPIENKYCPMCGRRIDKDKDRGV